MVKLYCDKCGEEIKDKYYTVNILEHETRTKSSSYDMATAYSSYTRENALEMLNSQKMYCKKCENDFKNFMNSKE